MRSKTNQLINLKKMIMKKLYTVLLAVLLALPLFAVEYQAPVTVWEGKSTSVYYNTAYNLIVPQTTFDWSSLSENTRVTIQFSKSLTSDSYIYLYACTDLNTYENMGDEMLPLGTDEGGTYAISAGESQYQFVLTGDDVAAFELVPSLFALFYTDVDMTKVLVEYPASATALQGVAAASIYAHEGTIVAPETAQIYSITGQNVTSHNGNLTHGIYVVRHGSQTTKVVVK